MASLAEFAGKWVFVKHENSEPLFAEMGIPDVAAKAMAAAKPSLEIYEDDGCWVLKEASQSSPKPHLEKFKLGEPTDILTMFGKRKIIATLEDGKLYTRGTTPGDDLVAVRELVGDQLVAKVTKNNVTGVCYFCRA
ncbi:fatty acid-binding protein homolog 5-like [Saccoglossus kowalevskii]|uniref:Fatty acid-binding protein homolog 5-like n=1 Tax=Saccoglossus kowalevskii TaxID=10224 RepID=A0ABM0M8Q2_SACKO|nr:PREDICTED: fatty acid-binding protein homolog 5-like [Saccoglossus kowalevskii]